MLETPDPQPAPAPQRLIGYPITLKKLAFFNLITLGFFPIIWAYKNFRELNGEGIGAKVGAGIFAWFLPLSLFDMMRRYELLSNKLGAPIKFNKYGLAWTFFLLNLGEKFVDHIKGTPPVMWLVFMAVSVLPLLTVQKQINALNTKLNPDLPFAPKLNFVHWIFIVLAAIVTVLVIFATIFPPTH